jgi:hypothetical protein
MPTSSTQPAAPHMPSLNSAAILFGVLAIVGLGLVMVDPSAIFLSLVAGLVAFALSRGSLRVAREMRFCSGMAVGALSVVPMLVFVLFPFGFIGTFVRVEPGAALKLALTWALFLGGASSVLRTLTQDAVGSAIRHAKLDQWISRPTTALGSGALLPVILAVTLFGGPDSERAIAEARREVGPDYEFVVHGMEVEIATVDGRSVKRVAAGVFAYKPTEVRSVDVHWSE